MATTYVHYMYHAPGATEGLVIAIDSFQNKALDDVLPLIGSAGSTMKVTPDDPDEYGDTREFEVIGVMVGPITYWRPDNTQATIPNMLIVSVTDPD